MLKIASSLPNPAKAIHQVDVSDLAVQKADVLADLVRERVLDNKILPPVGLAHLLADAAQEQADEHVLEPVRLDVDAHVLRDVSVLGEQFRQGRVLRGARKGLGLVVGPGAAEYGNDGRLADERRRRVALGAALALEQRPAVQVREVERDVALEEARRRVKGLALVERQVAPVAEIRSAELILSVKLCWDQRAELDMVENSLRRWFQVLSSMPVFCPSSGGVLHADRPAQRDGRELFDALAVPSGGGGELLRRRRDDHLLRSLCAGGGCCCFGGVVRRCCGADFFGGGLFCGKPPVRRAEGPALAQPAEQLAPGRKRHGFGVQHLMRRDV
ncbi:hypothetical protein PG989_008385 [Apiospora arundinis]